MPSLVELITRKRDGGELSSDEIGELISALGEGRLADYQMSAFCMAVFFRGMTAAETVALTHAMLRSGAVIDLGDVSRPKVDKHSTGGVGDKVSICLAPLAAACGLAVPMISGRGLGHTGGTLDKLEAIPGFSVDLDIERFRRIVREVGCCMIGQTSDLAPADKRIYALRDVTGTVESIPLIVASILSKKLAAGIEGLVLDVKVGRGAFMKTTETARELALALVRVGSGAGKRVSALITDMSAPLGLTVGNAIETEEALAVLGGAGPPDLVECTLELAAEMLVVGGLVPEPAAARPLLARAIASGAAAEVAERMIAAQGGDPRVVADPSRLPHAPVRVPVAASSEGVVTGIDALEIGLAAVALGAGRTRADQAVDPRVGIELAVRRGDRVTVGAPLGWLHVASEDAAPRALERVRSAFTLGPGPVPAPPLVLDRVR
ncbi:MAG: thymidine phosphorylase [Myxococcales bacterium]|nr:thymidine phosphorylase [Myxococcales bacterium]